MIRDIQPQVQRTGRPLIEQQPPKRHYAKSAQPVRRRRSFPAWLQVLLFVPLIMISSVVVQSSLAGQAAIVVYGIFAFWRHIPSRSTFAMALIALLATIVLAIGKGDLMLAQQFATYTFLLLVVGVVTLGRDLKKEGGRIYSIRQR